MTKKTHILSIMLMLGFALCLINISFADFAEKIRAAEEMIGTANFIEDDPIIEGDPEFPTAEGPEYIQDIGGFRLAPNFVFGPEQFEKMRDLPPDSQDYRLGTKIAYFHVQYARGYSCCTGFLVGPDLLMTNNHCLPSNISDIEIYMDYYQEPEVDRTRGGITARVTQVLRKNPQLDYALLRLDKPIGNTYGWLTLDTTSNPQPGQSVKLIHHSACRSKEISRQDSEIPALPDLGLPPFILPYYADTEGGTSGCPVFLRDGTDVIAINFAGIFNDINGNGEYDRGIDEPICNVGILMSYIVPEIEDWLPNGPTPPPTPPPPTPPPPTPPPPIAGNLMYWTDWATDKIQRANLNGSNIQDLITGLDSPHGITVDGSGGKIYWTDPIAAKILRADINGSNIQDLITGLDRPIGIAVDGSGGKIYWTDVETGKIQRANLNGSNIQDLVTGLTSPNGIAVDGSGGKMYWTDFVPGNIQRANLDGTNTETLVSDFDYGPFGIALDVAAGKMYWTNVWGQHRIHQTDLDGRNVRDLVITGEGPVGIAVDIAGRNMYWIEQGADKIRRASLNGTNVQDLVRTGLDRPFGLALGIPQTNGTITFDPSTIADQTFTVGTPVDLTLPTATGGTPPYIYSLDPSLPAGLYFDPIGAGPGYIGGTPTTIMPPTRFTYTARDANSASAFLTFNIEVRGAGPGPGPDPLDVNGDGQIDVLDLVLVAVFYGTRGVGLPADVNADGIVNVQDFAAVAAGVDAADTLSLKAIEQALLAAAAQAAELEAAAGAPVGFGNPTQDVLSVSTAYGNVADALLDTRHIVVGDVRLGRTVAFLETLLSLLAEMGAIPETTALLPNYPNPFNPETWIPYHLAKDAEVKLTIYNVRGGVVRELMFGHQPAGVYESRARAAYWDGKNQLGEKVASGVYFYTLTAGDFTATRKLLIAK